MMSHILLFTYLLNSILQDDYHKAKKSKMLAETLHMKFSEFYLCLWNLTFIFSNSYNKFSLVLLQVTNYIFSPWKNVKKNALFFKLFWYKVLVHWKLKLLNLLVDSVLIINDIHMYVFYFWYCAREVAKINIEQFQWPCLRVFMP